MTKETFESAFAAVLGRMLTQKQESKSQQGSMKIMIATRNDIPEDHKAGRYLKGLFTITEISAGFKIKDRWTGESAGIIVSEWDKNFTALNYTFVPYEEITAVIGRATGNIAGYRFE